MTDLNLKGIIAYPITPYSKNGELDLNALKEIIEKLIATEANAITVLGSAGESAYLEVDEWQQVLATSIQTINKRVPILCGIAELKTSTVIEKINIAEKLGVDGHMIIPLSYWKLSDAEILNFYQEVSKNCTKPIMLYNNPATSGIDMKPELIVEIFNKCKAVTIVKESTGDINRLHKIRELSNNSIPVYCGSNSIALEFLSAGGKGWCSAAPNIIGDLPSKLFKAIESQNLDLSKEIFYKIYPFLDFIVKGGLVKTVKAAYQIQGKNYGEGRKPLLPLSKDEKNKLGKILVKLQ
ncbi:MAG: dihydrodipicolinate synthase family protein [Candidatus Caenarcaniphilales bacterium]|nr:dihydrodipicolinate synthase family protein [Candidatus Caenarcaniphilales bacterium]